MAILLRPLARSTGGVAGSSTDDARHQERGMASGVDREPVVENIRIGDAELVRSYSLLIPQDRVARIAVQIRGWSFSLEIKFENAGSEEPRVQYARKRDDAVTLTLLNWNAPLGVALSSPLEIAHLADGSTIYLLASNQAIGATNHCCPTRAI